MKHAVYEYAVEVFVVLIRSMNSSLYYILVHAHQQDGLKLSGKETRKFKDG